MKDFYPNEILRGLGPIELIELREALSNPARRAADRTARDAQIAQFCSIFFGELSKRAAARAFVKEISEYSSTGWPHDRARGTVDPRAGNRRTRLFAIMRLSGGEPNRIRTIQNVLSKSNKF